MTITAAMAMGATLVVGGCAAPSTRIATGLERAGVAPDRARCVGDRLQRALSLGQLQQLGRAAAAARRDDPDPTRFTVADLVRAAPEIHDPRIALEVGKAAAGCGVLP